MFRGRKRGRSNTSPDGRKGLSAIPSYTALQAPTGLQPLLSPIGSQDALLVRDQGSTLPREDDCPVAKARIRRAGRNPEREGVPLLRDGTVTWGLGVDPPSTNLVSAVFDLHLQPDLLRGLRGERLLQADNGWNNDR